MITRYTKPSELIDEFRQDRERARYWLKRMIAKHNSTNEKSFKNFKAVTYNQQQDARSEVFEYDSPKFGNKWLLWWRYLSNGYGYLPTVKDYQILYYMTAKSMAIMVPTMIQNEQGTMKGVTLFTDHLFQRMADEDRLGVDMTDRKLVIRNFVEIVLCGVVDIREPRPGEKDKQAVARLPDSYLKGYIKYIGDSYLITFNTFIPEKTMTPTQRKYLKSFAKFVDAFTSKDEIKRYFSHKEDSFINNYDYEKD